MLCCLTLEGGHEFLDNVLQLSIDSWVNLSLLGDGVKHSLLGALDVLQEFLLELGDLCGIQLVQMTAHTAVDDSNLEVISDIYQTE